MRFLSARVRLTSGFLAAFHGLLFTLRQLGLVFGLFFFQALLGALLDLGFCRFHGLEPILAPGDFLWQAHAIGERRLIGLLGHLQQRVDLCLQLDFTMGSPDAYVSWSFILI